MSSFRVRPRFTHEVSGKSEILEQLLVEAAKDRYITTYVPGHLYIKIPPAHQHLWSPQLNLSFESMAEGETVLIRGLYGPNPTLWSIFFFAYAALTILSLFVGMWGFSQYSLGLPAQMLWALPIFALLAIMLYLAAQAGQKLGAQQMFDLHHFYEDTMGKKVQVD